jgi:ABC-type multidrug transport system ATPase subunit
MGDREAGGAVVARKAGANEVLRIKGLRRSFGELHVLRDVNLSLRSGQICAVTGPNGAGKTTLLRCVAGTIKPDAGEIVLLGHAVDEADPRTRAAVASVLDDVDFFPDLSVAEHLELTAYLHATPDAPEQRHDALGKQWLTEQLGREKKQGAAVLMASHDPELVDAVADVRLAIGE